LFVFIGLLLDFYSQSTTAKTKTKMGLLPNEINDSVLLLLLDS